VDLVVDEHEPSGRIDGALQRPGSLLELVEPGLRDLFGQRARPGARAVDEARAEEPDLGRADAPEADGLVAHRHGDRGPEPAPYDGAHGGSGRGGGRLAAARVGAPQGPEAPRPRSRAQEDVEARAVLLRVARALAELGVQPVGGVEWRVAQRHGAGPLDAVRR